MLTGLDVTRLVRLAHNVWLLLTIALVFVSTLSVVLVLSFGREPSDSSGERQKSALFLLQAQSVHDFF